jgi:alginate O-acetyltransferase complex protein AlgI
MVFSSVIFLFLFFPLALLAYFPFRNRGRLRNLVLLIFSLLFYYWGEGTYTIIMIVYIVVNFLAAHLIERLGTRGAVGGSAWAGRAALGAAVAVDLSLLFYYKYTNFILANTLPWLKAAGLDLSAEPIHLPIGISFFAFQAISYVIDVYRGDVKATPSLLNFAMYKSFFPQLIAGPIVRYRDVCAQVVDHHMTRDGFREGLQRFITGLAKKVIVANTAAAAADAVFAIPAAGLTAPTAWLGVLCYGLQIYFDFSGYSDMAIGMGRMFGLRFLENFNYPYISLSVREFWRRWHISLSTWFRDYLYIPLGGSRVRGWRVYFNLALVFFLCGLWHGASWTFVVWGLWHGGFLVLERTPFGVWLERRPRALRLLYTLAVVSIGWIFFRAENLKYAIDYLAAALGLSRGDALAFPLQAYLTNELAAVLVTGVLFSAPLAPKLKMVIEARTARLSRRPAQRALAGGVLEAASAVGYLCAFLFCSMLLASGTHNPFIYFRF